LQTSARTNRAYSRHKHKQKKRAGLRVAKNAAKKMRESLQIIARAAALEIPSY
jgi:hypothetical protein